MATLKILDPVRSQTRRLTNLVSDRLNVNHRIHDDLRLIVPLSTLLAFAAYIGVLLMKRGHCRKVLKLDGGTTQALCAVFTPTSIAWPLLCARLFKHTRVSDATLGRFIDIDVDELLHHVYNGDVEIRDARDLGLLVKRKLRVYGWDIGFSLRPIWWLRTARWFAAAYFIEAEPSSRITTQGLLGHWPLSCALRVASRPRPSFDLDFVAYQDIREEIRRIQLLHRHGNTTTIEFSCLGPAVRFMTSNFILCALPFIPNDKYMSGQATRINRTSTPLFMKLEDVVALLSSTGTLSINSIENISREHAVALYNLGEELVYNRNLRTEHIRDVGLEGWRKDRFMLAWEAGLLESGSLVRWRMKIGK